MPVLDRLTNLLAWKALAEYVGDRITDGRMPPVEVYRRDPGRWAEERAIAGRFLEYPRFGTDIAGRLLLIGFLKVRSKRNHEYGPFSIRIEFPTRFPRDKSSPSVYLMSHRDRWINGNDSHIEYHWRLCLFIAGESGIDFERSDSLVALLATVVTFLRKEVIYQQDYLKQLNGGSKAIWPGKDRAHGAQGLIQALRESGPVGVEHPCLCGSGVRFLDCCYPRVLREIDHAEEERLIIGPVRAVDGGSAGARSRRKPPGVTHRRGWGQPKSGSWHARRAQR